MRQEKHWPNFIGLPGESGFECLAFDPVTETAALTLNGRWMLLNLEQVEALESACGVVSREIRDRRRQHHLTPA